MTNILMGMNASVYQLGELLAILGQLQLVWGFLAGFGLAVLMYAFMSSFPTTSNIAPSHMHNSGGIMKNVTLTLALLVILSFVVLAVISTLRF